MWWTDSLFSFDCSIESVLEDFVCRLMDLLWDIITALLPGED